MSMACLKDNELSVLNSDDFCLPELYFLNTDINLVAPAALHYRILSTICAAICTPCSSALTTAVQRFLAWVEQRALVRVLAHELPEEGSQSWESIV